MPTWQSTQLRRSGASNTTAVTATTSTTPTPPRTGKARPQKAKLGDVELRVVQADERSGCISTASSDLDDLSSSNQ